MSWYSAIYVKARAFRANHPVLGTLLAWSFYCCILLELLIFGLATALYVGVTCSLIQNDIQASIYIVIYGLISFMCLWAYTRVLFARPVRVPDEYKFDETTDAKLRAVTTFNAKGRAMLDQSTDVQVLMQKQIMDDFAASRGLSFVEVDAHSRLRYCYECHVLKPDRTHHCSSCGFCAVRFDHHCPYLNTCVAFTNYKFFVLFLLYLECWLVWNVIGGLQAIISYFIYFNFSDRLDMIVPLALMFALQLAVSIWPLGELLRYHWLLISLNETTCEQAKIPNIRGDPKANYDVGRWQNIEIVMGWGLWLFPVWTSTSDGMHHPVNYMSSETANNRVVVAIGDPDSPAPQP